MLEHQTVFVVTRRIASKAICNEKKVNLLTADEAEAVYFFCVKVNDKARTDTIRIAKFIVSVIASKIVMASSPFSSIA